MEAVKKKPAAKKPAPKLTIDKQFEEVEAQMKDLQAQKQQAEVMIQQGQQALQQADAGILQCHGALAALKPFLKK